MPGFAGDVGPDVRPSAELVGDDIRTHCDLARAVATAALPRRRVEHDRDARHAGRRRPITPPSPLVGIETERVDDGCEAAVEPAGDDVVEQGESVGGCGEVVLALTDERAQRVARNDLRRLEPLLRPRRLAGGDRPDEHHHAG